MAKPKNELLKDIVLYNYLVNYKYTLFFLFFSFSFCQNPTYFIKEEKNIIQNASELKPFFKTLNQLDVRDSINKINIVHIGDSHIQADQLTTIIRQNFHRNFGDGGRGFIFPYELMPSNGAKDVLFSSTGKWESKRCVHPEELLDIGIGGVTIASDSAQININLKTINADNLNNSIIRLKLFSNIDAKNRIIYPVSTSSSDIAIKNYTPHISETQWKTPVNEVNMTFLKGTSKNQIFGMSIENNQNGVIYHSIGANGAQMQHFNQTKYFFEQLPYLNPNLLIVSLGTNEALDLKKEFTKEKFTQQVNDFFTRLKVVEPNTPILVTIPAESLKNKTPNPNFIIVREVLLDYVKKNKLAYWDLFDLAGGINSSNQWKNNNLLKPDGVHFTKEGYEYQGQLLYNAILKSYKIYGAD